MLMSYSLLWWMSWRRWIFISERLPVWEMLLRDGQFLRMGEGWYSPCDGAPLFSCTNFPDAHFLAIFLLHCLILHMASIQNPQYCPIILCINESLEIACMYKIYFHIPSSNYVHDFIHIKKNSITSCCTVVILVMANPVFDFQKSFFNWVQIWRV